MADPKQSDPRDQSKPEFAPDSSLGSMYCIASGPQSEITPDSGIQSNYAGGAAFDPTSKCWQKFQGIKIYAGKNTCICTVNDQDCLSDSSFSNYSIYIQGFKIKIPPYQSLLTCRGGGLLRFLYYPRSPSYWMVLWYYTNTPQISAVGWICRHSNIHKPQSLWGHWSSISLRVFLTPLVWWGALPGSRNWGLVVIGAHFPQDHGSMGFSTSYLNIRCHHPYTRLNNDLKTNKTQIVKLQKATTLGFQQPWRQTWN